MIHPDPGVWSDSPFDLPRVDASVAGMRVRESDSSLFPEYDVDVVDWRGLRSYLLRCPRKFVGKDEQTQGRQNRSFWDPLIFDVNVEVWLVCDHGEDHELALLAIRERSLTTVLLGRLPVESNEGKFVRLRVSPRGHCAYNSQSSREIK